MHARYLGALGCSVAVGLLTALAFAQPHGQGNPGGRQPPQLKRQYVGAGNWQSHRPDADQRGWQLQLQHFDDDSLTGRITVIGSPLVDQGRIVAQLTESEVDGVLLDGTGRQVGTFTGALVQGAVSGTYTMIDGDTGAWNWDGPPPWSGRSGN